MSQVENILNDAVGKKLGGKYDINSTSIFGKNQFILLVWVFKRSKGAVWTNNFEHSITS